MPRYNAHCLAGIPLLDRRHLCHEENSGDEIPQKAGGSYKQSQSPAPVRCISNSLCMMPKGSMIWGEWSV